MLKWQYMNKSTWEENLNPWILHEFTLIYKENKVYLMYTKPWFNLYFQGMKHISQYVFQEQKSKYQKPTNKILQWILYQ